MPLNHSCSVQQSFKHKTKGKERLPRCTSDSLPLSTYSTRT